MKYTATLLIALLLAAAAPAAFAFAPDGCELQRAQYPKRWRDVSREKAMFTCTPLGKAGGGTLAVRLGGRDRQGRRLMSVSTQGEKPANGLYRMWLDREQAARLNKGEYFATVVRRENTCWIRSLSDDNWIFFLDHAPPERISGDVAPRVSLFGDRAFYCSRGAASPPPMSKATCEQQRARYPKDWRDTSNEKPVLHCAGRGFAWRIRLGEPDAAGRSMLSMVAARYPRGGEELSEEPQYGVYRAWLDADQARRLRQGQYFATPVRDEESCWADGKLTEGGLLFVDAADPPPDTEGFGSFYNKAPRFSVFGDFMQCKPVKDSDR